MTGLLLAALDQTIVSTALKSITEDFNGLNHYTWVVTAYLLTSTASTPLYGKISDIYGRRPVFQFAIVTFLLGSLLAGAAQDMNQLIATRALQGLGAGGLMALTFVIIGDIVPPRERGRYVGYFGAVWGLSSVAGPLLPIRIFQNQPEPVVRLSDPRGSRQYPSKELTTRSKLDWGLSATRAWTQGGAVRGTVETSGASARSGALAALGCYLLWGLVPLYWKRLAAIDSLELIAHRHLWSLALLGLLWLGWGCSLPLIAEDLGVITPPVEALRDCFRLPGMKILQFAFDGDPENSYLPANYQGCNWCVYTGTHDNATCIGWWQQLSDEQRHQVEKQLGPVQAPGWQLLELALASQADWAVVPLQDLLQLGDEARFNTPGTSEGNWQWRLSEGLEAINGPLKGFGELAQRYQR